MKRVGGAKRLAGTDGIEYAALVGVADRSLRKTLATAALGDRRRFARLND